LAFSPDGQRVASDARDHTVKVWNAQTGREVLTIPGNNRSVRSIAFSLDGKRLAIGKAAERRPGQQVQGEVAVCDAQTGQELLTLKHTATVDGVAFSSDGKLLAGGIVQGRSPDDPADHFEVKVWDAQTGKELLAFGGKGSGLVFSPDGKRLATRREELKVWDAQTGEELLAFGEGSKVAPGLYVTWGSQVAFSPDGTRLASTTGARMAKVWDVQTRSELFPLKGHVRRVLSVAYSPDGKRLASVDGDQVKVWDAQTGQELLTLQGDKNIRRVVFSQDGHRLASGSSDGTLKIWDATPLPAKP
jgi:WD40 repeat protein